MWVGFDQPKTILPNGFAAQIAVPLWTTFMKAATRDDKPEWFTPPAGVTTATVCRLSGKLASEGCDDTYTEFFAQGTQPAAYCDMHPTHGLLGRLAGLFFSGDKPSPPRVDDVVSPPAAVATESVGQADPIAPMPPKPAKKRGFWSRLLGR